MAKKLLLCLFSILFSFPIYAQNTKFTTEDDAFFESQMSYFQQWLNEYKIGDILKTDRLVTDLNEGVVTVYLKLNYQTADSAVAAYDKLKAKFAEKNTRTIEQLLFYKVVQLMEVNANQLKLEIIDRVECKRIKIGLVGDAPQVQDITCRSIAQKIDMKDFALKNPFIFTNSIKSVKNGNNSTAESDAIIQQNTLKKIRDESQKYFAGKKKAVFNLLGLKDGLLRFEVNDVKQEILRDGSFFDKYETITFSISCQKINTDTRINFIIDAKSGASFPWKPRTSAFTPIDATKEGKYQMEKYAYLFGAMIEQWLSK